MYKKLYSLKYNPKITKLDHFKIITNFQGTYKKPPIFQNRWNIFYCEVSDSIDFLILSIVISALSVKYAVYFLSIF